MLSVLKRAVQNVFKPNAQHFNSMEKDVVKAYNLHRTVQKPKALCYAPFTNLYFGRNGNVVSCCHNRKHIIGNYPAQTISEIWNGEKLQELRDFVSHNDLTSGCHVCKWNLDQQTYGETPALHFDTLPLLKSFPSMMEFELDNTCNLECTMCSGEFSSSIRKNRDHKPPIRSAYDAGFVTQLEPFLPHLTLTRFSGGEPFLIDIYHDIWQKLVELNPECLVSVQTNGTVLNNRVKNVLEKGKFEIGISIDSLQKETYEAIRKNGDFDKLMKNVAYFADYCQRKGTSFRISVCAMRENWMEIPEFIAFCKQYKASIQIHNVWFPPASSLWNLDKEQLRQIHAFYTAQEFTSTNYIEKHNEVHYKNFVIQIAKWMEAAAESPESAPVETGSSRERLLAKMKDYIQGDSALSDPEKEVKILEIIGKADRVFDLIGEASKIEQSASNMLEIPVELIVSSLAFESDERVLEQATAFLQS